MLAVEPLPVTVVAEALWHRVPGGTGVATKELLTRLARRPDLTLDAVAARRSGDSVSGVPVDVRSARLPRVALYEAWARTGRPDVTGRRSALLHSPMLMAPTSARVPVVVTVHDLAWQERPEDFPRRPLELYRRMWTRIVDDAAHIICSSEVTARGVESAGVERDRITVVHLGGRHLAASATTTPAALGLDGPFVLSVGTAEPRKNLRRLLWAFDRSELWRDGVRLAVVGPTGWRFELTGAMTSMSDEAAAHVVALGRVTDDELGALYRDAVAFAYPSLLEGFGLPVLEALAAGAPVVTSADTSTAEVAGDAGVLVDPTDVDQLGDALVRVVTDTELRDRLAAAAPQQAARFSWERHIDETVEIYRKVAA